MKKVMLIGIIILTVLFTGGCWSRKEIEDLGFVIGLGISQEESGLYSIIAQVANPNVIVAEHHGPRDVYTIMKSEGITIFDALRNLSLLSGRRLYFAHIKTIIIHESVAKEGLSEVVGFLLQDMEVRLESEVFVSKIPPEDILDTPNTLGAIPSMVLERNTKIYGGNSKIFVSDMHKTLEAVTNPVINYATALVEKIPSPTEQEMDLLKLTSIAVFDSYKLIDYLNYEEGQAFNFITNNYKNGLIIFHHPVTNDKLVVEMLSSNAKITSQYVNDRVGFHIKLEVTGNLAERMPAAKSDKGLNVEEVQKLLDEVLLKKLQHMVNLAQNELYVDIFNLSSHFSATYPNEFNEFKHQWNEVFSKSDITIEVESTVIHTALNTHRGKI